MRTTLTLGDDIALALRAAAQQNGTSFDAEVNKTLRAGLECLSAPAPPRRYRWIPKFMGPASPGIDLTKALQLADALEGFETALKCKLRK